MKKLVDVFEKNLNILSNKKLFLFDMDGTIYNDNCLFDNAINLFDTIENIGGNYVFITNNSSKSINDYIEKLEKLGIKVKETNFLTSTQATILYLKEYFYDKLIYCMGTTSFINELRYNGINVTEDVTNQASAILIGYDTELKYEKIKKTCQMLKFNIPYLATNPDLACPTEFGFVPDCGSIAQMIYNATKKSPLYIGKPEPTMVKLSMNKFRVNEKETVVIGDRLYTDILSGINAGVLTICVLTGEATIKEIVDGKIKPDLTLNNISEMYEYLKNK